MRRGKRMWRKTRCYFRKKNGNCPYKKLLIEVAFINRLYARRAYIKAQQEALRRHLLQGNFGAVLNYQSTYYDGFCWKEQQDLLDIPYIHKLVDTNDESCFGMDCPYQIATCEIQLMAKKSQARFLGDLLRKEIEGYNQEVMLHHKIQSYFMMHLFTYKADLWYFTYVLEDMIGLYWRLANRDIGENSNIEIVFWYNSKSEKAFQSGKIIIELVDYSQAMRGTTKATKDSLGVIAWLVEPNDWLFVQGKRVLYALEALLRQFNCRRRKRKEIVAFVMPIEQIDKMTIIRSKTYYRDNNYEILGKINDLGEYKEDYFLYKQL